MLTTPDFLIIGGGILGITLSLEAKRRHPDADVLLIEKESDCGLHASGRNSGVLHAGFYYGADSLKARFTRDGNRELTQYCLERGLQINRCGKLVVARDETELAGLDELLCRGRRNGVELEMISADDARRIEPRIRTHERALWSPTTASVDPREVMASLVADARECGVEIATSTAYRSPLTAHRAPRTAHRSPDSGPHPLSPSPETGEGGRAGEVRTSRGRISPGYVINAAGLYADTIARDFGFSRDHRILPFKGVYLHGEPAERLRTNVYPVPDLGNPWLGVHFTVRVDGRVKIGPTAMPAFWREHYGGLRNFRLGEFVDVVMREAGLFARNDFGFRAIAGAELRKYSRRHLVRLAGALVRDVAPARYRTWGEPGIRAQLVNIGERKLEMDFRFDGDDRSFHVLNAVSPAFTCALPFSRYAFDEIEAARA